VIKFCLEGKECPRTRHVRIRSSALITIEGLLIGTDERQVAIAFRLFMRERERERERQRCVVSNVSLVVQGFYSWKEKGIRFKGRRDFGCDYLFSRFDLTGYNRYQEVSAYRFSFLFVREFVQTHHRLATWAGLRLMETRRKALSVSLGEA